MAKFYVSTKNMNRIVSTNVSAREAAKSAILQDLLEGGKVDGYGDLTEVNETGFAVNGRDGLMFSTPRLLTEIGVL